jgi:hypothetical protein
MMLCIGLTNEVIKSLESPERKLEEITYISWDEGYRKVADETELEHKDVL